MTRWRSAITSKSSIPLTSGEGWGGVTAAALRGRLELLPPKARQRAALARQYDALTGEFDRRARAAWHPAETQPGHSRQRGETDSARYRP